MFRRILGAVALGACSSFFFASSALAQTISVNPHAYPQPIGPGLPGMPGGVFVHPDPFGSGFLGHPRDEDTGLFDDPINLGGGFSLTFDGEDCLFHDEVVGAFRFGATGHYNLRDDLSIDITIGGRTGGYWGDSLFDRNAGAGLGCFIGGTLRW